MWRTIDLVLRYVYVAGVPFLLPTINLVMPITGLLIGTGVASAFALVGSEVWRARVEKIKYLGRAHGGMGRLGEFYARFPPKPLVYYIFYPLILPVILFMRIPRAEFFLYRRLNALAAIIIAATGAYDYFDHWRPELTLRQFAAATLGMFIMQMLVTFMFIMPIVTTLVELRQRRRTRVLWLLAVLMLATGTLGAIGAHKQHTMTIMTWMRLQERTKFARSELRDCEQAHPDGVRDCVHKDPQIRALANALEAVIKSDEQDLHDDDAAIAVMQDKLAEYYKPDEAAAFRLAAGPQILVVFARYPHRKAIWLGATKGRFLTKPEQLPAPLRKLLGV
jgi:hypothetical protein